MASEETGLIYTAGMGIRLWKFAFEISGAMAAATQEIEAGEGDGDGVEIPERASFAGLFRFSTQF